MDIQNIAHEEEVVSTPISTLDRFRRSVHHFTTSTSTTDNPDDLTQEFFASNPELHASFAESVSMAVAPRTLSNYGRVIRDFEQFCLEKSHTYPLFNIKAVLDFIITVKHSGTAGCGYINMIKPAIDLLLNSQARESKVIFTQPVIRFLSGLKRHLSSTKPEVSKMKTLSANDILLIFNASIEPFLAEPTTIPLVNIRTMFRISVIFYTFCRFHDFNQLRARHFRLLPSGDIMVFFPSAKNDQYHAGNSTPLLQNTPHPNPVLITRLFFQRAGFLLLADSTDDRFVNFSIRPHVKQPNHNRRLSYSNAIKDLRQICTTSGIDPEKIGEKSAKMGGVTHSFAQGASASDVMHHGRWRSENIVFHYKENTQAFKLETAAKNFSPNTEL